MRCPDCSKFVSFSEPEGEVEDTSIEVEQGVVLVTVRIDLPCAECGSILKSAWLEAEIEFPHDKTRCDGESLEDAEIEWNLDFYDRFEDKDRNGKPIKNMRYMKHYYGVTISGTLVCDDCGETSELEAEIEEQASGFEEQV